MYWSYIYRETFCVYPHTYGEIHIQGTRAAIASYIRPFRETPRRDDPSRETARSHRNREITFPVAAQLLFLRSFSLPLRQAERATGATFSPRKEPFAINLLADSRVRFTYPAPAPGNSLDQTQSFPFEWHARTSKLWLPNHRRYASSARYRLMDRARCM